MSETEPEMPDVPDDTGEGLHGQSTRLFQMREDDLAELERLLPILCGDLYPMLGKDHPANNRVRSQLRRVKDILSNVRWGYGPPLDVKVLKGD